MSKAIPLAIATYIFVGVITWGHAYHHLERRAEGWEMLIPLCSLLWPLYWSVEVQK